MRTSTASGSSPENGSSSTSRSGSLTRASASCTRCWLPDDRSWTSVSRRSLRSTRSSQRSAARSASCRVEPGEPGVVDDVVPDPHLRVHAPLGRHVADPPADGVVIGLAVPGDAAAVEADEAEDGSHRRGLPGAVRAEEAEEPPPPDRQADPVQGHDLAVALDDVAHLEHAARLSGHFSTARRTIARADVTFGSSCARATHSAHPARPRPVSTCASGRSGPVACVAEDVARTRARTILAGRRTERARPDGDAED